MRQAASSNRHAARRGVAIALLLAAGVALVPSAASSQPSPAGAQEAQVKFAAAQKRYQAGDFAAALEMFRDALAGSGSPNARLYVARCLRETGKLPEAYAEMRRTARESAERAGTEKRYQETQRAAEAELAALEARVARVVVTFAAEAPAGAEVRLGGEPLAADRVGEPIAREPGNVTVEATAPGRRPWTRDVTLSAGSEEKVEIGFEPAATSGVGDTPPASSGGQVRTAGIVVAAVGVAGMGLFAVAGVMAKSRFDTIVDECGGKRCTDAKYDEDIDSGETMTTLANVGLVLGIAGLVGGGAMILLGGPKEQAPATGRAAPRPRVGLQVSPWSAAVTGRF